LQEEQVLIPSLSLKEQLKVEVKQQKRQSASSLASRAKLRQNLGVFSQESIKVRDY